MTRNAMSDKPATKTPGKPGVEPNDPPTGLPDLGAPGLGADEMPGGLINGGDGKQDERERKDR